MNWVGGSRSRLVMKHDAKKQREFFERRKIQQRLRNLGVALPTSPGGNTCGSMDLVTLFIVNQIAAKKEKTDPPKVSVFGSSKGGSSSRFKRSEPVVLPMSPCSPSQLDLVEGPSSSFQAARKGKNVLPHGFKSRQLSPVLESAFSDISASDYLPHSADPHSPFSSISLASSGKVNLGRTSVVSTEIFPTQQRNQTLAQLSHYSPPPWDSSGLQQIKFQPFSPTEDGMPWSDRPNTSIFHLETPTAAQALFGGQDQGITEARDFAEHEVTFTLNQSEDTEPMLDFTFNQPENEQQIQDDIFRAFSAEDCRGEAFLVGSDSSKIYLTNETPIKASAPQTVPDLPGMEMELSNCTGMNCSHLQQSFGPLESPASSPSYPCSKGYLSSDSDDGQQCCHPRHPSASVYVDQRCEDNYHSKPGLKENAKTGLIHLRLPTPPLKPQRIFSDPQQVMESVARLDKDRGSTSQLSGSSTVCFDSPEAAAQTRSSELCKCKTTLRKTLDKSTQTDGKPGAETCDASTQCSSVEQSVSEAPRFSLCLPPFGVYIRAPDIQDSASRRQAGLTSPSPSEGNIRNQEKHLPWSKERARSAPLMEKHSKHKLCALDENIIVQMPVNSLLQAQSKGKKKRAGRRERGGEENGRLMTDVSNEVREEVTSAMKVNRLSEETQTLQEIADILLQLKQRQGEGN